MTTWREFSENAPAIAAVFSRRLTATKMGLLATLRSDGFPRISPLEPKIIEGELWLGGMPNATKSRDLRRDSRCCLHSATEDTEVKDGDAKLWGHALEVTDSGQTDTYSAAVLAESGFDLTHRAFDLFRLELTGGSAVEVGGDHLRITTWRSGEPEHTIAKYD